MQICIVEQYVLGDKAGKEGQEETGSTASHTIVFSDHIWPATKYDFAVKLVDPLKVELKSSDGTYELIEEMSSKVAKVACYSKPSQLTGKIQS